MVHDVGIYTRWQRREDTHIAIQLAEFIRTRASVSFLTSTTSPAQVHLAFDDHVRRARAVKFTEWCRKMRLVVWTRCPHIEQVLWAKNNSKRTVLVASCQEDEKTIKEAYPAFHTVVAPTRAIRDLLTVTYKLENVALCCWSPSRFVWTPDRVEGPPRILFPLAGTVLDSTPVRALAMILNLMRSTPAHATLVHSGWSGQARRLLEEVMEDVGDRLTVLTPPDYIATFVLTAAHDCTALLSRWDPVGLLGLESLHAGTPILTWDVPWVREYAEHGRNAALVPIQGATTSSYSVFERALLRLGGDLAHTIDYRRSTRWGLVQRRLRWEAVWEAILKESGLG